MLREAPRAQASFTRNDDDVARDDVKLDAGRAEPYGSPSLAELGFLGLCVGHFFGAFSFVYHWEDDRLAFHWGCLLLANLVFFGWDNFVLCVGRLLGRGRALETMSRARYLLFSMLTPCLLAIVASVHCEDLGSVEATSCERGGARELGNLMFPVLLVLNVAREVLGGTMALNEGDFGNCLAKDAVASRAAFVPRMMGRTLSYRPLKPRIGYAAAYSLSVLLSLWRGIEEYTNTTGRVGGGDANEGSAATILAGSALLSLLMSSGVRRWSMKAKDDLPGNRNGFPPKLAAELVQRLSELIWLLALTEFSLSGGARVISN